MCTWCVYAVASALCGLRSSSSSALGAMNSPTDMSLSTHRRRPPRSAFSVVELLIVIGIIGLLLSLLTPAVQYCAISCRNQCVSNLRQLGVVLQAYHDAIGRLPPAATWGKPGEPLGQGFAAAGHFDCVTLGLATAGDPDRMRANWLVLPLPFFDEESLYYSFDLHQPIADPTNRAARVTELRLLKCPSDFANVPDNPFQRSQERATKQLYAAAITP